MDDRAGMLTATGTAALAVVRITGSGLAGWCASHLSRPPTPGRCVHVELRDEKGGVIDDPVAVLAPDGSFLDLSLHGGAWVVESALALLRRRGFAIVDGLELIREHADAIEHDVLAAVPRAASEAGVRCLLAQPQAWRGIVPDWRAFWADRSRRREQVEPNSTIDWQGIATDRALWWLLNPPTVAIVGAPNVGKSSLANRLLAQERSIVAEVPGTTRDWVGETVELAGMRMMLVDTPGIRVTDDPIERLAIRRSGGIVSSADLVLVVIDATRGVDSEASRLLRAFTGAILVANKIDLPAAAAPPGALGVSARTGAGESALIDAIARRLGVSGIDPSRPRLWLDEQFAALGEVI